LSDLGHECFVYVPLDELDPSWVFYLEHLGVLLHELVDSGEPLGGISRVNMAADIGREVVAEDGLEVHLVERLRELGVVELQFLLVQLDFQETQHRR
jgi:hypothetical protein